MFLCYNYFYSHINLPSAKAGENVVNIAFFELALITSSNQSIGITTSEIFPVSLKRQKPFFLTSETTPNVSDLGIVSILNSVHFLHVEVELQADGHVQRDTR